LRGKYDGGRGGEPDKGKKRGRGGVGKKSDQLGVGTSGILCKEPNGRGLLGTGEKNLGRFYCFLFYTKGGRKRKGPACPPG